MNKTLEYALAWAILTAVEIGPPVLGLLTWWLWIPTLTAAITITAYKK